MAFRCRRVSFVLTYLYKDVVSSKKIASSVLGTAHDRDLHARGRGDGYKHGVAPRRIRDTHMSNVTIYIWAQIGTSVGM